MKRLVICADGTWNFRDQVDDETRLRHATNVTKVARGVLPKSKDGTDQIVIYHKGIGTQAGLDHVTGGAFGKGLADNVRELYRSLIYNYSDGDELYFWGFSRGAFTVRTLAGFMKRFGLLQKADDFFVPDLFRAYQLRRDTTSIRKDDKFRRMGAARPCPPIKFMGVWDTVSALGWPGRLRRTARRKRHGFHDVELGNHIKNAYQALAIDEQRVPFAPLMWTRPPDWRGDLQQVWFAGVHCSCGGGYSPDGLANEALHWMIGKAETHGLEFDSRYLAHFKPCFNSTKHNSMTFYYRVLGKMTRFIGQHRLDGEAIHQSALDRLHDKRLAYKPKNLLTALAEVPALPLENTTRIARSRCVLKGEKPNAPS